MALHPWWFGFGQSVASPDDLASAPARELAAAVAAGAVPGVMLTELKACAQTGRNAVGVVIEVEAAPGHRTPGSRDRADCRGVRGAGWATACPRLAR